MRAALPFSRSLSRSRGGATPLSEPCRSLGDEAYKLSAIVTAIQLFVELLKTDTTNPPGTESPAAELLAARLSDAGLETKILASPSGRPNLVARLPGPAERPALVLLSHTDVVAVEREGWTRDPFGGEIHDGAVWGRGALDMKGVAVMHAEAVAALAESGATPAREVIVCAAADEEAGGQQGAAWLVEEHPELLGFGDGRPPPEVLGEGAYGLSEVVDEPVMPIAVAEKLALWLRLTARGEPGHGMRPPANMATANLSALLVRVAGYGTPRIHPVMKQQFAQLAGATTGVKSIAFKTLSSGAGTLAARALSKTLRSQGMLGTILSDTISVTEIQAGYKHNVVPGEATASLDCRILPDTNPDDFIRRLRDEASGYSVDVEPARATGTGAVSSQTALYEILASVSAEVEPECIVVPTLCPGMTDVRYFRERGAQGYGWVPVMLTDELLRTVHGHDERIPVAAFERGVEAMTEVVRRAAA